MLAGFASASVIAAEPAPLKVLFLGDQGHHRPADRFRQLRPPLALRGIDLTYTERVDDLNPKTLAKYDALVVYANIERITPEQEQALLEYVASGKGFVPLHCASYCFLNSPKYVALVGAQFQRHDTGTFTTDIARPEHPIMSGYQTFESWDETYVHHRHNEQDRLVLEYRAEGDGKEPWSWVRTHGKGRVFYTAWGHDDRTFGHPGFHTLVERGIRWVAGQDPSEVPTFIDKPEMTALAKDAAPFEFREAKIPFYPKGKQWGTIGEPISQMQKPLEPAESMKHMVTPVDFEVRLVAADPDIAKPICLNWDERGRLWIAETVDYPNEMQPAGKGRDRIRICEDTDGDGKADKFTVFADNLSIPTSMVFARGGVIVTQAPHMLFLRDTNGDDVADERQVLFTGWATNDTHAGPSNLRYGLDGWIYGMVGYAGFEGTVGGEQHSFRQGFFRFRPDGSKLEFLRNTNNNSWGVGFSEEGVLFGSTANGCPSVYLPIPNRYYESVRGWSSSVLGPISDSNKFEAITENVRQVDWHGGFTAGAGHALYTARTYPPEYWNRTAFVTEPTGHLVATFCLQQYDADYRSRNRFNLLASDDGWVSPIVAEVGPDGNVWVIDWYNYIVQHNPTPAGYRTGRGNAYESDLRDKTHGRIYRVVYLGGRGGDPLGVSGPPSLKEASPEKLVQTLKHDNMFWRLHAQRLLVERGKTDVVPALIELAKDQRVDEVGLNAPVIHALWTLHGLGAMKDAKSPATAIAVSSLKHVSPGVRRTAVQVLPRDDRGVAALVDAGVLNDIDGRVRLAGLLALAETPESSAGAEAVLAALANDANLHDRWLLDGATAAAARHAAAVLALAAAGRLQEDSTRVRPVLDRLRIVAEHFGRTAPGDAAPRLIAALGGARPEIIEPMLAGLERGWPRDKAVALDATAEEALAALLPKVSGEGRGRLVALAARWGSKSLEKYAAEIAGTFLKQVQDEKQSERNRLTAAAQLIDFRKGDPETAADLLKLLAPRTSPEFSRGLLDAIGRSEAAEVGAALVENLGSITPAARPTVAKVLLSRAAWTPALVNAIENGQLQLAELSLEQKQSLAAHPDREIARRAKELLARGGALPDADRQKVLDELLPLAAKSGDADKGKEMYKKHCSKCHVHGEEGTRIGPDLTGMAVHPKAELLTNIIDPSRSVEGNFRIYSVLTRSGQVITGLLTSESKTALELVDVEAKKQTVLREDIEEFNASKKSLMPEGFEKQISQEELTNLLEFLARRGKYLPLDLRKVATIVTTRGMFFDPDGNAERLIFRDWSPKTFDGVPFQLVDPQGDRVANAILLYGPQGNIPPTMPKSVTLPCNAPAKAIHFLSGVSGWGYPLGEKGSVSMTVRLHFADGKTEDHALKNGEHFADYIRRVDVPGSKFAYALRGQQLRYLSVVPERHDVIKEIELVKGPDATAPIVMAVTLETAE